MFWLETAQRDEINKYHHIENMKHSIKGNEDSKILTDPKSL